MIGSRSVASCTALEESVYLVNGRRCRLRDIHRILEELGLDYASYALIAQGKIDSFMTAKPLERRAVIEEAARITGYKSRRRRAELKLGMAEQNLLRISDIVVEVERRLRSLKRQAAKARRYKNLKDEYRSLQKIRFVLEAAGLQEELEKGERQLVRSTDECNRLEETLQAAVSDYRQRTQLRNRLESELSALAEQNSKLLLEVDRTTNSIASQQEQIQTTVSYLEQLETDLGSIRETLRRVQSERARFEDEIAGISKKPIEMTSSSTSIVRCWSKAPPGSLKSKPQSNRVATGFSSWPLRRLLSPGCSSSWTASLGNSVNGKSGWVQIMPGPFAMSTDGERTSSAANRN